MVRADRGCWLRATHTRRGAAQFFRFFGDSNGAGQVDAVDQAAFQRAMRSRLGMANYRAYFDFRGIGMVDSPDYNRFLAHYKRKLNPDGTVSILP